MRNYFKLLFSREIFISLIVFQSCNHEISMFANSATSLDNKLLFQRQIFSSKYHACFLCNCKTPNVIKCLSEKQSQRLLNEWKDVILNASFFEGYQKSLTHLHIEFDAFSLNLRVQHNAFAKLKNLRILSLVNILDLKKLPNLEYADNIKELTIQKSGLSQLSTDFCLRKKELQKIDFSYNELKDLKFVFTDCTSLKLLDLSSNQIESLEDVFNEASSLFILNLDYNLIRKIGPSDFLSLVDLSELSIAKNHLEFIHQNAFDNMKYLVKLNLGKNDLYSLPPSSVIYSSIRYLDIKDNNNLLLFPESSQFKNICELHLHYSYHCCPFLNRKKTQLSPINNEFEISFNLDDISTHISEIGEKENDSAQVIIAQALDKSPSSSSQANCFQNLIENPFMAIVCSKNLGNSIKCSPMPDVLTPCENLLEDWWLRTAVWLVSTMGILSNICVIAYNVMYGILHYLNKSDINVSTFLLTNLAAADSLMSVYLLFIAVKDSDSRNSFGQSALNWQNSFGCNLAGFLSIFSSVSSALCLVFITFERYYSIKNSIDLNKRLKFRSAVFVIISIWLFSFCTAMLPLFGINSYSEYAICLPFDTKEMRYKVYIIVLNSLLVTCFFFICILYGLLFVNTIILEKNSILGGCNNEVQIRLRTAEDQKLARNITLLVMLNTICWGPVVFLCAKSLIKNKPIDRINMKILAVFVIPFNSLINPFLYCISRRSFRMYVRANFFRSKFRRNFSNSSARSTTTGI